VVFGFFFVTVSSRIVGLLGSSSNPISGMTIATLLLTCVLFLVAGLGNMPNVKLCILIVGAFVCIAAAIAGDTSQDLKTGFLVGATPRYQQIGEFFGVIASGLTMGFVMYLLREGIVTGELPAPQANLMKLVVDGVIGGSLPWNLVFCGVFIAVGIELLGINSLAFAVGLYLPMSLSVPIMAGGIIRWALELREKDPQLNEKRETGVLYSSGLIAGAALTGVLIMVLVGFSESYPGFRTAVSRPGIYLESIGQATNLTLNGQPFQAQYHPIAPSSYADAKKEIQAVAAAKKALQVYLEGPQVVEARAAEMTGQMKLAEGKLAAVQKQALTFAWQLDGKSLSKIINIAKWDKKYISITQDGVQVSGGAAGADTRGVIIFLILALSLGYFAMRKPSSEEKTVEEETV